MNNTTREQATKQLEELKVKVKELEDTLKSPEKVRLQGEFYVTGFGGVRRSTVNNGINHIHWGEEFGNVYLTKEAAQTAAKAMRINNSIIAYVLQKDPSATLEYKEGNSYYLYFLEDGSFALNTQRITSRQMGAAGADRGAFRVYMSREICDQLVMDLRSGAYTL